MTRCCWIACGAALLLANVARAATDVADCAAIEDDAARLACYDRLASVEAADGAPPNAAEEVAGVDLQPALIEAAAAPAREENEAPEPTRLIEVELVRDPPAAEEPEADDPAAAVSVRREVLDTAAPSIEAPPAERAAKRGFFRRLLSREGGDKTKDKADITGKIVRITKLPLGNFQLTLDDGQVWRENERETHTSYAVGDVIVISEGAFGSHDMTNQRTGQSIKARRVR